MKLQTESNSIQLMEEFFPSYRRKTILSGNIQKAKEVLNTELYKQEGRRFVFGDIIVKYRNKQKYETDILGLNSFLYDLGILQFVNEINTSKCTEDDLLALEPFFEKGEPYVKFTPNKNGKIDKSLINYDEKDIETIVHYISNESSTLKSLDILWNATKDSMLEDRQFQADKKLKTKFGTLSYLFKKGKYDLRQIANLVDEDFLINFTKPTSDKLEYYIRKGFIKPRELDKFRTVVGECKAEMIITDIRSESNQYQQFYTRLRLLQIDRNKVKSNIIY